MHVRISEALSIECPLVHDTGREQHAVKYIRVQHVTVLPVHAYEVNLLTYKASGIIWSVDHGAKCIKKCKKCRKMQS